MDLTRAASASATLHDVEELSPTHSGRSALVRAGLPQAASHATAAWTLVRDASIQGHAVDSCLTACVTHYPAHLGGCALSSCGGLARTPGGGSTTPAARAITRRRSPTDHTPSRSPVCHDGTERPIPRPDDATAQKRWYRGKKKRHMLNNLLLVNRGVGKEKRNISDHRLQTIDFLRKCRNAISRLSIIRSREIFGSSIEKSTASLYNDHFS
jgi:hypothetical protein